MSDSKKNDLSVFTKNEIKLNYHFYPALHLALLIYSNIWPAMFNSVASKTLKTWYTTAMCTLYWNHLEYLYRICICTISVLSRNLICPDPVSKSSNHLAFCCHVVTPSSSYSLSQFNSTDVTKMKRTCHIDIHPVNNPNDWLSSQ